MPESNKIEKNISDRDTAFKEYCQNNKIKKLQIGAGGNFLSGWFSTDLNPKEKIYYLNLKEKFPFDNSTFDYIYSEHNIEHFTIDEGVFILKECYRVLKSKGKIRIATPDLKRLIKYYENESEINNKYTSWEFNSFIKKSTQIDICTKSLIINNFYRCWGHKLIYDFELLKKVLEYSGFVDVHLEEVGISSCNELRGVEQHLKNIENGAYNKIETMVVEASKKQLNNISLLFMNKKYAILFSISNSYAFALCNALMSLAKNSPKCVENCDILIYSNDLTENNKNVINKINSNCKFYKIQTSENNEDFIKNHTLPEFFLEYPAIKTRWGIWNLFKLAAYTFLEEYEKILILDADIYVNKDIYQVFNVKNPYGWRQVHHKDAIEELKKVGLYEEDRNITFCCGGMVLITNKILDCCSIHDSIGLFSKLSKNKRILTIDEMIHTWIAYKYKIPVSILHDLWNDFNLKKLKDTKVVHFWKQEILPWKNKKMLDLFPEWLMNHKKILELGIDSEPKFNFDI